MVRTILRDLRDNGSVMKMPACITAALCDPRVLEDVQSRHDMLVRETRDGLNTRSKSDVALSDEVSSVLRWADLQEEPTPMTLFCVFLPPRRPSDLETFAVVDSESDPALAGIPPCDRNLYVRNSETLIFNRYKNSHIHGEQRFHIRDPRLAEISLQGSGGVEKAIAFLHDLDRFPAGQLTYLMRNSDGARIFPTSSRLTASRGGFNNNAFRHAIETRAASGSVSRAGRLYALKFLAHSAHTAMMFYSFDDGKSTQKT